MTDTPTFNDLTPPLDQLRVWIDAEQTYSGLDRFRHVATEAYRAGARHRWEQARQLWPEPITDRPPTFDDGDEEGYIQVLFKGCYVLRFWGSHQGCPWLHTPRWQPRQPSPVDTLAAIIREVDGDHRLGAGALAEAILSHPDTRRALEQAGEGQA